MYKDKIVIKLSCPKHKGYSPKEGQQGIKGACQKCYELFLIYNHVNTVEREIKEYNE